MWLGLEPFTDNKNKLSTGGISSHLHIITVCNAFIVTTYLDHHRKDLARVSQRISGQKAGIIVA